MSSVISAGTKMSNEWSYAVNSLKLLRKTILI